TQHTIHAPHHITSLTRPVTKTLEYRENCYDNDIIWLDLGNKWLKWYGPAKKLSTGSVNLPKFLWKTNRL
ncbi:MAG: hypothetical protein WBL49_09785, partial [Nitrososphaeraceae archaeon]